MANKKITDYTADTTPASGDLVETVDVSDTTYAVTGTNKQVTATNFIKKAHGLSDGIVKVATGTMAPATAGTDYYNPGGTDVAIADGGTGASSKAAGFDALSPMSASGDIVYGGASGTGTRLAKGSDTQVLTLAAGVPSWATPSVIPTTTLFNGTSLTNAAFKTAFISNKSTGQNDIYTAPAGKRALITGITLYNAGAVASTSTYPQIKYGGNYYRLTTDLNVASTNSLTNTTGTIILEPTETIVLNIVTASVTGMNAWVRLVEFDNTSPLKTSKALSVNGDNTVYTCPALMTATLLDTVGGAFGTSPKAYASAYGGTGRNMTWYLVPSGGSAGSTNQAATGASVSANQQNSAIIYGNLVAGDQVVMNTNGTGVLMWVNVVEAG